MHSFGTRFSWPAAPRPLQMPSMPPRLDMGTLDESWAEDLLRAPHAFAGVKSLRFEHALVAPGAHVALRLVHAKQTLPLANVKSLSAPKPQALIAALRLDLLADAVKIAHVAADGTKASGGDKDIGDLFRRYRSIELASVCRCIVAKQKVDEEVARLIEEEAWSTRRRVSMSESRWDKLLMATQSMDVARTIFCASKEIERIAPASLVHFGLVFDAREVPNFQDVLLLALFSACDQANPQGPLLADALLAHGKRRPPEKSITWGFAWLPPCGMPLEMYSLQGTSRGTFRLEPGRWPIDLKRPLSVSVLSKLSWCHENESELRELTRSAAAG